MTEGNWWPLLSELLAVVTKCLRSEAAAKRFLLDYFERNPIEWRYECTAEAPQSTMPPELRKGGLDPIPTYTQEAAAIYHCFWQSRKESFNVEWEESSVSYDGPLIKVTRHADYRGGNLIVPLFDGFWRVKMRISLICINAVPIIAKLRSLGLLPLAVAASLPLASAPPPHPPNQSSDERNRSAPERPAQRSRKRYTTPEKTRIINDVVALTREGKFTEREFCRDRGIPRSTLQDWLRTIGKASR